MFLNSDPLICTISIITLKRLCWGLFKTGSHIRELCFTNALSAPKPDGAHSRCSIIDGRVETDLACFDRVNFMLSAELTSIVIRF